MKKNILLLLFFFVAACVSAQRFSYKDYCLVWSDEFNVDGAPNPNYWHYEEGYVRNNEDQYYTNGRLENARIENGHLIIEAKKDNWQGHEYTSASLITSGKITYKYGKFEIRAKIDTRSGSWPAFWALGESGEWPSNGEIDIMEYYNNQIHANVAWGTETRWQAHWDSQTRNIADLGTGWADQYHIWSMEWTPDFINLYVDDILINTTDLSQTINGSISNIENPFHQGFYILLNQAIGGNNGGDPSNTSFPVSYVIDYVRIYQPGNCNLDCNWNEGGLAYTDQCMQCVGGNTGKPACVLNCTGNLLTNPGFETGDLSGWAGWGTRSVTNQSFTGNAAIQIGAGAAEMVINVLPNTNYTLKAKGKKSGGGWMRLGVKEDGAAESWTESSSTTWTDLEHTFTTGNSTTARIYFYNGSGGTAYADDFDLQPIGCSTVVTAQKARTIETEQITLYPNPSEKSFTCISAKPGIIRIYDAKGQMIKELKTDGLLQYGATLEPGVYSIHFISAKSSKTRSWIKL